eukprot:2386683-Pyramimonas_sp.AAC.1
MSCITHGGLRGFWGKMFQNGQGCPSAFGYEPVMKILRSRDMSDADTLLHLAQEATALVQLAKGVLGDERLARRYRSGCSTSVNARRPGHFTLPHGEWHSAE